jgi:hypothetical protein
VNFGLRVDAEQVKKSRHHVLRRKRILGDLAGNAVGAADDSALRETGPGEDRD